VLTLRDGELVDGEPVVVPRHIEVDDPHLRPGDPAVLAAVLDGDAIDQHPVHRAVALHERQRIDARELAVGILQGVGREVGIQARERLA